MPLRLYNCDAWNEVNGGPSGKPVLSQGRGRETYPNLTNRSVLLRLMGPIIAVLLAITMAVFPISVSQAVAWNGPEHAVALDAHHTHDEASVGCGDAHVVACGDHRPGHHDASSPGCCGMAMCHAFQVSAAPDVHSPHLSVVSTVIAGDEQVDIVISGRLDRPPRTI